MLAQLIAQSGERKNMRQEAAGLPLTENGYIQNEASQSKGLYL